MDRDNIIRLLGAKTYGSYTKADYDGIELNEMSLQFYNNGWIYGYKVYWRNDKFPVYIVKENEVLVVYSEERLMEVGKQILDGSVVFTNYLITSMCRNTKKTDAYYKVRTDKDILMAEEGYTDNLWIFEKIANKKW